MAWEPLWQAVVQWDRATALAVAHRMRTPALDVVMPHITDLGLGHVQAAIVLAVALVAAARSGAPTTALRWPTMAGFGGQMGWVAPMLLAIVLSGLVTTTLKEAIDAASPRLRPVWYYVQEHRRGRSLETTLTGVPGRRPLRVNGFPSGHTATSFAVALVAVLLAPAGRRRRLAAVAIPVACIVGYSRIYMADHWPLDVLGGACIGALCGLAALAATRRGRPAGPSAASGGATP